MTDPIQYPSTTPRYSMPLLFAGQAQKEFFVNAALSRFDALIHSSIEGEADAPPADPADDGCWLVAGGASGTFAGRDGHLAFRQSGEWTFVAPRDGMRTYDRSARQFVIYAAGWHRASVPAAPGGGETIDAEARTAINEMIAMLRQCGILPAD